MNLSDIIQIILALAGFILAVAVFRYTKKMDENAEKRKTQDAQTAKMNLTITAYNELQKQLMKFVTEVDGKQDMKKKLEAMGKDYEKETEYKKYKTYISQIAIFALGLKENLYDEETFLRISMLFIPSYIIPRMEGFFEFADSQRGLFSKNDNNLFEVARDFANRYEYNNLKAQKII